MKLSVVDWLERAKETLEARLEQEEDTQLLDAHDDICNALSLLNNSQDLSIE